MRMKQEIREILNMFKWHPDYDFQKVSVAYVDRPKGLSVFHASDIVDIGHKFIYLKDDVVIPIHRVMEIRYDNRSFWRRGDERGKGERELQEQESEGGSSEE
ncbi:MAG: DUF504 domain-containing protein [Archaeoglobaceae archaeon]